MKSMAVLYKDLNEVCFGEVEIAEVGENDVLLETLVSLVSTGTELRVLRHGYENTDFPIVPGYSAVSKIVKSGKNSKLREGAIVFSNGGNRIVRGAASLWGAHCQYQVFSASSVIEIDDSVSPEEYAFSKVLAIPLHGARRSLAEPGDKVVVLGQGLIGQLAARILVGKGIDTIAVDINEFRLAKSEKAGAIVVNPERVDLKEFVYSYWPDGPDIVLEVTSIPEQVSTAIELVGDRRDGNKKFPRVVLLANYTEPLILNSRTIFLKECDLVSSCDVEPQDLIFSIDMIRDGMVKVDDLVTAVRNPEDAKEAYQELIEHSDEHFTVIFRWNG